MFCPSCGTRNEDASRFCSGCGQQLQESPDVAPEPVSAHDTAIIPASAAAPVPASSHAPVERRCRHCKMLLPVGTNKCPHCGHEINWALRYHLAEQTMNKPVRTIELKPVSTTWLWCLALVPFPAMIVVYFLMGSGLSCLSYFALNLVFLALDQYAIRKSGRGGYSALLFVLFVLFGLVAIPAYLFSSGKDTKRGTVPGFAHLGVLAVWLLLLTVVSTFTETFVADNKKAITETAKQVVTDQLLPSIVKRGEAECIDIVDMKKIGDNKWSATAMVELSDRRICELPVIIRRVGDKVYCRIDEERLVDRLDSLIYLQNAL